MHHQKHDDKFVSSLNRFFSVIKLTDEFEIISKDLIINKCVIIENNDLFLSFRIGLIIDILIMIYFSLALV